ncbi:polysaccharide deacetylase family protein [Cupriavidus sp. WS]|uniref:polysaccharide deacetylase family protein n=1 Tax=Cupriavidus sp. WS TaxID=1312922 RepID=UPI0003767C0D|nr:polysaccharide deacetylase family protein [Cupriavidus sp. WS]
MQRKEQRGRWRRLLRRAVPWPALALAALAALPAGAQDPGPARQVPVLVYHRFGPVAADSMTVRTATFEAHLRMLAAQGYHVVPLADVVRWQQGGAAPLPAGAVAITADDGHRSVFEVMMPIARREHVPVTLFIYPSAISNAAYALTWDQLRALKETGLFTVQSHSYWHPNFNTERKRLAPEAFRAFAHMQLRRARERLEQELGGPVRWLAWPFGIHDEELMAIAADEGVEAAFSLEGRAVTPAAPRLALPRFLMTDACGERCLARILAQAAVPPPAAPRQQSGAMP